MLRNQQLLLICALLCLLRGPLWGYFFFFSQTFLFPSSYNVPCLRGSHLSLVRYAWLQGKCANTLGRTEACTNSPRWYLSTSPWTPKTLVRSQLVLVRKVVHNLHSWWAKVPRSVKKRTKMSFSSKFVKKKNFKQHFTKKIPHNSKFEGKSSVFSCFLLQKVGVRVRGRKRKANTVEQIPTRSKAFTDIFVSR